MKLMRFNLHREPVSLTRLGVLLPGDKVGDLRAAYARFLTEESDPQAREIAGLRLPPNIMLLLSIGDPGWKAARAAYDYLLTLVAAEPGATGIDGEPLISPLVECRLHATIKKPYKFIAIDRNYPEPSREAGLKVDQAVPSAWLKANNTIIGPYREIVKPACVKELDYATQLVVVIGKQCRNVPEKDAFDVVAGYIVMNDFTARDILRIEQRQGNQLMGKMFDGFAPLGPWMVTADEIPDPMNLRIMTHVNGEVRQDGSTKEMIFPIPRLIAFLSQMTLEPGDMICTGSPAGSAVEHGPGEPSGFLNAGDVLESEIEGIGVMRNTIEEGPSLASSWSW